LDQKQMTSRLPAAGLSRYAYRAIQSEEFKALEKVLRIIMENLAQDAASRFGPSKLVKLLEMHTDPILLKQIGLEAAAKIKTLVPDFALSEATRLIKDRGVSRQVSRMQGGSRSPSVNALQLEYMQTTVRFARSTIQAFLPRMPPAEQARIRALIQAISEGPSTALATPEQQIERAFCQTILLSIMLSS
jgi:hypothetical protein